MTTRMFSTAMQCWLRSAVTCCFACAFSSHAVWAQETIDNSPGTKIPITRILVPQQNRRESKTNPFPQGSFTQQVAVSFKTKVPTETLRDVTKWKVTLYFENDSNTVLRGKADNCATTPQVANCWSVITTERDGKVSQKDAPPQNENPPVSSIANPIPPGFEVILTLPESALSKHVVSLVVDFDGELSPPWSVKETKACMSLLCAATNKSTSDNYLSGLYSPAIHSSPQYTIDGQGRFVKQIGLSSFYGGAIATVSTDQRPSADPNSFLVSGVLQVVLTDEPFDTKSSFWSRVQMPILNWEFAGLEFDRQTTTKTFISSPIVEIPYRVFGNAGSTFSLGMFPYFGIETGTNLSNGLSPDGSGFVFRGELGSSVSFKVKPKNWKVLSQIGITSSYTARIPATAEIFTNTHFISATGKTVTLYTMSTQVRNHLKDELDFTVAKPVSISIKHEYGELPPGFRTIHNKVSIGLTVMLFQNNTASSSVSSEQ